VTVPGAPRTDPEGTGGDPAARGRFGLSGLFRRTPGHIGRARTSTLVLALLFVGLGVLYLYVRPADPATDPAGGTTQVSTPAPAPATTTAPPTTEPAPTTPEETTPPTTTGLPTDPTTTAPDLPTGSRTTEPSETEPGGTAPPTTDEAPPAGESPAPTTGSTPTG
jgi:cytoskeletal protein RodZ